MLNGNQSLGVMAANDPRLRSVLERLGIDYVTCGDSSLEDAAASEGLSITTLETELLHEPAAAKKPIAANGASLTNTLDVLRREHRARISDFLWRTSMLLDLVSDRRLVDQPQFHAMRIRFEGLVTKIAAHIEREDELLFPLIAAMESAWIHGTEPPPQIEGGLRRMVASVFLQHAGVNSDLKALRSDRKWLETVSAHPDCVRIVENLRSLEAQLHDTMNLENFAIYPAAIALEDQLYGVAAESLV
jgi:regulator of cell morphogenesis and NO signaling